MIIDAALVRYLVATQFPQWKDLPVLPVAFSGWDNRTFHLGDQMLVRMPSAAEYAFQVEKEQYWLPKLAPLLPLAVPEPLVIGEPADDYPWKWSIYRWIEGTCAANAPIADLCEFAATLSQFLAALQRIDAADGPLAGAHSFYRGGSLAIYDAEVQHAIDSLKGSIDRDTATEVWQIALSTIWKKDPVWVHGDVSVGNLLVKEGRLSAVIDFGQLSVGDPACDLVIAWTLFEGKSRKIFRSALPVDSATWSRGRAWALWKALITAAGLSNPLNAEARGCWRIIDEVLADHKNN